MDFEEVYDETGEYFEISQRFQNQGHSDIRRAVKELRLAPVHNEFTSVFEDKVLSLITDYFILLDDPEGEFLELDYINQKFTGLINIVKNHFNLKADVNQLASDFEDKLKTVGRLNSILGNKKIFERDVRYRDIYDSMRLSPKSNYRENEIIFLVWLLIRKMNKMFSNNNTLQDNFVEELVLDTPVRNILKRLGKSENDVDRDILLLNILNRYDEKFFDLDKEVEENNKENFSAYLKIKSKEILEFFEDPAIKAYLGINRYEGVTYYSKENFENLINWLFTLITVTKNKEIKDDKDIEKILRLYYLLFYYVKFYSDNSEYKLESLQEKLKNEDEERSDTKK